MRGIGAWWGRAAVHPFRISPLRRMYANAQLEDSLADSRISWYNLYTGFEEGLLSMCVGLNVGRVCMQHLAAAADEAGIISLHTFYGCFSAQFIVALPSSR